MRDILAQFANMLASMGTEITDISIGAEYKRALIAAIKDCGKLKVVATVHQSPFGASLIWKDGDCVHMPHGAKLYINEGLDDPAAT